MDPCDASGPAVRWEQALGHMREALRMLDESDAPPEIGGYLDLALCRLEEALHGKAIVASIEERRDELERLLEAQCREELLIAAVGGSGKCVN